jgi:hypothetical protein
MLIKELIRNTCRLTEDRIMKNLMRILLIVTVLLGVIVSTGCQQHPIDDLAALKLTSSPVFTQGVNPPTQAMETPDRQNEIMTKSPERVSPTPAVTPVTGEVPPVLLESILKDLSERTGVSQEKISVVQAQEILWSDGSMGCPKPGVFYTQAMVNGFQVILEVGDQKYDYHASETGYYVLCESGLPNISPPGTPNS